MIWGITLQPGELYTETIKDEVQLSMAALESRNPEKQCDNVDYNQVIVQTDTAEYVLCTLVHGILFQQYLDMKLMPGEKVKFCVQGKYIVHLTGYSLSSPLEEATQTSQGAHEDGDSLPDVNINDSQEEESGWQQENAKDVKEEPPEEEEDDVIEVPDDPSPNQEYEQEYSKPSVKVTPTRTPHPELPHAATTHSPQIQHRPIQRQMVQVQDRKPQIHQRPQMQARYNQRTQAQMQPRARRRLMPGQRSQFRGAMQRANIRNRGASSSFQQRRMQRNIPSSHMRTGPRIRVQPAAAQPTLSTPHQSPVQSMGHHTPIHQQQLITEAVSVPSKDMYPVAVQQVPNVSGTQVQDLPGTPIHNYASVTDLGEGIILSDSSGGMGNMQGPTISDIRGIAMSNVQGSPVLNVPGPSSSMDVSGMSQVDMSQVDMSGMSVVDLPGTSSMDMPGTSLDQMSQDEALSSQHSRARSRRCNSEGGLTCQFCPSVFLDFTSKYLHEQNDHRGERMRQCFICKKVLSTVHALRTHASVHTGEKPHSCRFCSKRFRVLEAVRFHEYIHTGERPYSCRFCEKKFNQPGAKGRHEQKTHPAEYQAAKRMFRRDDSSSIGNC